MNLRRMAESWRYDASTGLIHWRHDRRGRGRPHKAGDVVGHIRSDGRRVVTLDASLLLASRVAWALHYGREPRGVIDHIDGNPSNDCIENLRECSQKKNALNVRRHCDNQSSRWKGVYRAKGRRRYSAAFRGRYLGSFDSEQEAAEAYNDAAIAHDPNYCRLNGEEVRLVQGG